MSKNLFWLLNIEFTLNIKKDTLLYSPKRHANAYQTYTNRERPSLGANSSCRFDSRSFGVSLGETYLKFTLSDCQLIVELCCVHSSRFG